MNWFNIALLALTSVLVARVSSECDGVLTDPSVTRLNFFDTPDIEDEDNTLHLPGGELRYREIGIANNIEVDLVVTVTSGSYTDIARKWALLEKPNSNGKRGEFGKINFQTEQGVPDSGEGNFRMCFVEANTNTQVQVRQFAFSIFDLDERKNDTGTNGIGLKEKFIIDVKQAELYQLDTNTQIVTYCEDGSSMPCPTGERTVFHSSQNGTGDDNPSDPEDLSELQRSRSVTFTFANTTCWDFTFDHYCPVDQPGYDGDETECRWYGGGFLLFAGDSEIVEDGVCITKPPTTSPSAAPSSKPSPKPPACECPANDDSSGTFKCSNNIYVCPGITRVCNRQKSRRKTKYYAITADECDIMQSLEIDDDCPALDRYDVPARGLSNRACYDGSEIAIKVSDILGNDCDTCDLEDIEFEDCPDCEPSAKPSSQPSTKPSSQPSAKPSAQPSAAPSSQPIHPSSEPSTKPSAQPSDAPSSQPIHPSSEPSTKPSVQPSAKPSAQPSAAPSSQPIHPSSEPSTKPSVQPSTKPSAQPSATPSSQPIHPSSEPSAKPSAQPSATPSAQPIHPSSQPSAKPSLQPSSKPSSAPSFVPSIIPSVPPPACEEDVSLLSMEGATTVELGDAVRILDQSTTSVQVRLYQAWTSHDEVDSIYYTYRESAFKEICHEEKDVPGSTHYKDITIKCYQHQPVALLGICVADNDGTLDPGQDNAKIPQCCHSTLPSSVPVVCYKIIVRCDSLCVEATERRALRRRVPEGSMSLELELEESIFEKSEGI